MVMGQEIKTGLYVTTQRKRGLSVDEKLVSVFLSEEWLHSFITRKGLNPINFKTIKCNYKGEIPQRKGANAIKK